MRHQHQSGAARISLPLSRTPLSLSLSLAAAACGAAPAIAVAMGGGAGGGAGRGAQGVAVLEATQVRLGLGVWRARGQARLRVCAGRERWRWRGALPCQNAPRRGRSPAACRSERPGWRSEALFAEMQSTGPLWRLMRSPCSVSRARGGGASIRYRARRQPAMAASAQQRHCRVKAFARCNGFCNRARPLPRWARRVRGDGRVRHCVGSGV